jgi:cysteine-dependent adenosine diphosphate thiazole synthase
MTSRYFTDMDVYAESDIVIIGAGSAGLSCAYELTKIAPTMKVSSILWLSLDHTGKVWISCHWIALAKYG